MPLEPVMHICLPQLRYSTTEIGTRLGGDGDPSLIWITKWNEPPFRTLPHSSGAIEMQTNIIERAFELAAESGSIAEVKRKLSREGYFHADAYLTGKQIRSEIILRLNPALMPDRKRVRHAAL